MADTKLLPQTECVTIAVSSANHSDPTAAPMIVHNGNGKAAIDDDKYNVLSETPPPDGGTRAWCVMVSAFLCNSILFGIINTCGTIYLQLQEGLELNGDSEASSKAGTFTLDSHSTHTIIIIDWHVALDFCVAFSFLFRRFAFKLHVRVPQFQLGPHTKTIFRTKYVSQCGSSVF